MKTREQLAALLGDPNVRAMLDTIAAAEGVKHGYQTGFGNDVLPSLEDHPRYLRDFTQTDGKKNKTSAAGRYQFTKGTWDDAVKALGLDSFGPQNQDLAALWLLDRAGSLDPLLKGDFKTAVQKAGPTWASLPSSPYAQNKRSWDFVDSAFAQAGGSPSAVPDATQPVAQQTASAAAPAAELSTEQARDIVAGAFAGFQAQEQNPYDAVRNIQQEAAEDALMSQNISNEANSARQTALAAFFGEDPVPTVQLPRQLETAINRELSRLG